MSRTALSPWWWYGPNVTGADKPSMVKPLMLSMASTKPSRVRLRPAFFSPSTARIMFTAPVSAVASRPWSLGSYFMRMSSTILVSGSPGTAPITV